LSNNDLALSPLWTTFPQPVENVEDSPSRAFGVCCDGEARRIGSRLQKIRFARSGGMAEWFKAHAWKACVRQKRTVGSNPTPSAILPARSGLRATSRSVNCSACIQTTMIAGRRLSSANAPPTVCFSMRCARPVCSVSRRVRDGRCARTSRSIPPPLRRKPPVSARVNAAVLFRETR
jgi:hypothetical protein